ncbi:MAG: B12-binding domain-containing radical SAM protein [Magnetococcales bacterium]|nr:B12-binding domain-containing radical SAM protein [Magnetococcales bacterium]
MSYFGFRKIAAIANAHGVHVAIHVIMPTAMRSLRIILRGNDSHADYTDDDIEQIAQTLAGYELLAVSSMSREAYLVKRILTALHARASRPFLLWGGIHPTISPLDALDSHADAICLGEGEMAFAEFLENFHDQEARLTTRNFWFRTPGGVQRNPQRSLATSAELESLPFPLYGQKEYLYRQGEGFQPIVNFDYLDSEAMAYNTVWTRGCPFKCTYCSNSTFLKLDRNYAKVRHASIDHLIAEIRLIQAQRPYLRSVTFHDDCFMALEPQYLRAFADQWRQKVNLPFCVLGLTPIHVDEEKMAILVSAGMNRVRMGIQSGSDRILKFYKRPSRPGLIQSATAAIARHARFMVAPSYDIIVDNPIETSQDILATVRLVNDLPRPFTLSIFSLRTIPYTELEQQLESVAASGTNMMEGNYLVCAPTFGNILLYCSAIMRIPPALLNRCAQHVHPAHCGPRALPGLLMMVKLLFFTQRAFQHLRQWDFSVVFGRLGWVLWRCSLLPSPSAGAARKWWSIKK